MKVGRREIEITRPEKVLFPDVGITKADFVGYHVGMAERMLPFVRGRPLSMKRYPDGVEGHGFFQKEASPHFPDWIERAEVAKEGGAVRHAVVRGAADLAYLAGQAVIEPHVWLSTVEDLRRPDTLVFDLDPSTDDVEVVRAAASATRAVLEDVGLPSFLMTSGSRGYHLWVPLRRGADWNEVRGFARGIARAVVARDPDAFTIEHRKADRGDRVFIDFLRNGYAQTSIPPYGVRARSTAPVATPLGWDELGRVEPRTFTIGSVVRRRRDPWRGMRRRARSLEGPRRRLARMLK